MTERAPARAASLADERSARHVIRVRVHADQDFRAQTLRWRRQIEGLFERASARLAVAVDARFAVVSIEPWERHGPTTELQPMLGSLAAHDAGADVDWVVGFVSALNSYSSNVHHLGIAHQGGRHAVLRGMNDLAESRALDTSLNRLSEDERSRVYRRRKVAKEEDVLLHEWAHCMGAGHILTTEALMNPEHSHRVTGFHDDTLALLRRRLDGGPAEAPQGPEIRRATMGISDLHPDIARVFNEALTMSKAGRPAAAWARLEPVVNGRRDSAQIQALGCHLAADLKRDDAAERCAAAADLDEGDLYSRLNEAIVLARSGDGAGADAATLDGRRRLEAAPADARPPWDYLTGVHRQQFHVTHAVDAAGRSDDAELLRRTQAWAAKVRTTFSAPAGAIPPDQEGAYIRAMRQALSDLDSRTGPAAARKAAEALSRAYPDAAGPYAIRCEAAVRSQKPGRAEKACDEALRLWDGSVRAQYFGAITDLHRGKPHRARKRLRRAIELDPELDAAWQTLWETLIQQRRRSEVDALEAEYRAQFGRSLR